MVPTPEDSRPRFPARVATVVAVVGAGLFGMACHADTADNPLESDDHAVILLYHHVSEGTPPSTSVSPATFESHLDYLADNGYRVIPLADVVAAFEAGTALPADSVAITFDDAYVSVYEEALPRLEQRGWPFTVFVSTDYIDDTYGGYMSWEQLRDIRSRGGTIGNHSAAHRHLVRRGPAESADEWRERVASDIAGAQSRLEAELGDPLRTFAYPYGEFDAALERVVADLEFVAFGQQSGPAGPESDRRHLPRFPLAGDYADLESLGEKLRSRPLPVRVIDPDSRVLPPGAAAPTLTLELRAGAWDRQRLRCYVAGQPPAEIRWHGNEVSVTARQPLRAGRSKFNCTAPSNHEDGVFYWYSYLWIQPREDGSWYPD